MAIKYIYLVRKAAEQGYVTIARFETMAPAREMAANLREETGDLSIHVAMRQAS